MRVFWIEGPAAKTVQVPGPADLQGRRGEVILTGTPSEGDHARWGQTLGEFALRGGKVHWGWL